MRKAGPLLALLAALVGATPSAAFGDPILVIVASDALDGAKLLDASTLRRLYLGRQTRFGGLRIECHALPPGSPARAAFNREILRLDEDELDEYWIEQALRGGALPPAEFEAPGPLIEHVRKRSQAIGYLLHESDAPVPEGVRFLRLRR